MNKQEKDILAILNYINSTGSYSSDGAVDFVLPGLKIKGFGEVGFPFNKTQAKALIKLAKKAPFGKGSETVLDETVRKSWEIDASQISFTNKKWRKKLHKILTKVQEDLGLQGQEIEASLYKLLIYEKGGFFLPHQDSEKEPGMFGTLVIGLPSKHKGGEFHVRFDGKEEIIDFSNAHEDFSLPYVAFYADCEHEIKPVTKGYRLSLTYNLIQKKGGNIGAPEFSDQVKDLTEVMGKWHKHAETLPAVVLLDHQYTPSNFSEESLKLHDKPRVQAILDAAEKADCFASLGLVTHHQMGELDTDYSYSRRRNYYDDDDDDYSDAEIGEIYEEDTTLTGIESENRPSLGEILLSPKDIIMEDEEFGIGDEPIEKEAEGYTGNAGMTMDYWYHYGAVFFWPKSLHADFLMRRPLSIQIDWLNFYMKKVNKLAKEEIKIIKKILSNVNNIKPPENTYRYYQSSIAVSDLNGLILAIIKFSDSSVFEDIQTFLSNNFTKVSPKNWIKTIDIFGEQAVHELVVKTLEQKKTNDLNHVLDVLVLLQKQVHTHADFFINNVPQYLKINNIQLIDENRFHNEVSDKIKKTNALKKLLTLSKEKDKAIEWQEKTHQILTQNPLREYVNEVLFPVLQKSKDTNIVLYQNIKKSVIEDLEKRTAEKPQPPKDFSRKAPRAQGRNANVWKMLKDFIESPIQEHFDYAARQDLRSNVSSALSNVAIDLRTQTIKKGSPHTLRLIKTQKSYERALSNWEEDVKLLSKLKK